jgi:hypothetical protein
MRNENSIKHALVPFKSSNLRHFWPACNVSFTRQVLLIIRVTGLVIVRIRENSAKLLDDVPLSPYQAILYHTPASLYSHPNLEPRATTSHTMRTQCIKLLTFK